MVSGLCIRCKGKGLCGQPCKILTKFKQSAPKIKTHFSGATPPEVFVGRMNYPNVFSGILAPNQFGNTTKFSTPAQWIKKDLDIETILELRGKMIYSRNTQSHIKSSTKMKQTTKELALSSKPVSTEFFLRKKPSFNFTASKFFQIMTNPAPLKKAVLEENPKVEKKVDYLTNDYDAKSVDALNELYKSKIQTTHLQKLLAVGLLGRKIKRKMVPTRWAITAVDDTLGKNLLDKIRYYKELAQIELFHHDYNGNHFEVLLLPAKFSFEVIEVSMSGSTWASDSLLQEDKIKKVSNVNANYEKESINSTNDVYMQDYEGFYGRKQYAKNVVGAYYADRLAVCEYLEKIKRQASVLVLHEERPEYYAPLGVGIIRESLRKMFASTKKENPNTIEESLISAGLRMSSPISKHKKMSWLLENYGKQKTLKEFF